MSSTDSEFTCAIHRRRDLVWVFVLTALLFSVRLMIAGRVELFQDEALYHWMGIHAPLGFSPHPPGIPLFARMGTALFGKTEFGLRFFSVLITTGSIPLFYLLSRRVLSQAALLSTAAFICVPIYMAFGCILTPDGAQLFFWILLLLSTWWATESDCAPRWIGVGVVAAAGLYFKFILILYFPSLLLFLMLWKDGRRKLRTAGPWLCMVTAFVLFVPAFLSSEWLSDWPTLRYHLRERQKMETPGLDDIVFYYNAHALFYSPLIYAASLLGIVWTGIRAVRTGARDMAFLFSFSACMFVFFAAITAITDRGLSREQWDAPAYVTAIPAAVALLRGGLIMKRVGYIGKVAVIVGAVSCVLVVAEATGYVLSRTLKRDPYFRNTIGWRAMAAHVDDHFKVLKREGSNVFFLGESFATAVQYAFYRKSESIPVFTLENDDNGKYGLRTMVRQTGLSAGHAPKNGDCLLVLERSARSTAAETTGTRNAHREASLLQFFESVEEQPSITIAVHGHPVKRFRLYRCGALKDPEALARYSEDDRERAEDEQLRQAEQRKTQQ